MPHRSQTGRLPHPWIVRPYRAGDERQGAVLFEEVFGKPMTPDHYRWKVGTSPWWNATATVWYADLDGDLVGQYAGTPMRFKLGDTVYPVLHGCDVMTKASYRGQGVLTALGTAAHEAWSDAGISFVTGLHYGGWGSRRHFLGWTEVFKAVWMWRPLRPGTLWSRRRQLPTPVTSAMNGLGFLWNKAWDAPLRRRGQTVEVEHIDQPGAAFDVLWNSLQGHYEALVVRDRAWISYRYRQAPDCTYRILLAHREGQPAGYLVFRVVSTPERTFGMIADLFTAPDDLRTRSALLLAAMRALADVEATDVRTLVPVHTRLFSDFKRAGFIRSRGSYDISIVPLADPFPYDALHDPTRWFTLGGDFDVV